MMKGAHEYSSLLIWEGNTGEGTKTYAGYGRQYRVVVTGKPDIIGSADPAFRGDADKLNPEDLFLASLSSCHMLSYLALCALQGVRVLAYVDEVKGTMTVTPDGGGKFDEIVLNPKVTISDSTHVALALNLHDKAHEQCFIANSCSVPVRHKPIVKVG
ncbi:MAG: OsmC family protein [Gemmatimonadales bacterium]